MSLASRIGRLRILPICLIAIAACVGGRSEAVTMTCTGQNIAGYPYSGTLCGGSVIDGCSPGEIYSCVGGPRGTTNNCTLSRTCSVGCLTGNNSTPVTANTATPQASDACFSGPAPLTLSSSSVVGGNNVTLTATLTQTHSPYAIVNLNGLSNLVAPPCDVPVELLANTSSISLTQPTAVVASTSQTQIWTLISYTDSSSGRNRNLVSLTTPLTLQSGGSVAAPPLASFSVTDGSGNPISTVAGGANAFTRGTLSGPAPFAGADVTVTTSPTGAFTTNGNFSISAACTTNSTWGVLTATSTATSNIAATVTATSGAGSPISKSITVTAPPLAIQSVRLNPTSVTGGGTSIATVDLNRAANGSDPTATVSVRVSEGNLSGAHIATFPGCTGSPACTGPVTVAVGANSASVTLSTSNVTSQDQVTVAASAPWSNSSASANLTITPGACTPKTCSSLGFICGSASDGCGGTLSCGTCPAGQTCTNNTCMLPCTPTTCAAQGKNCGSISDGCGGTLTCGSCTAPQTCGGGGTSNVCGTPSTVTLSSLTLNPTSVNGGDSSQGTVRLTAAAPSGGAVVTLSSSNTSVATVPASVTVAAGQTSKTFTVSTQRPSSNTTVTISATYGGVKKSAPLTVTSRRY